MVLGGQPADFISQLFFGAIGHEGNYDGRPKMEDGGPKTEDGRRTAFVPSIFHLRSSIFHRELLRR
jgi:hypothetical protein